MTKLSDFSVVQGFSNLLLAGILILLSCDIVTAKESFESPNPPTIDQELLTDAISSIATAMVMPDMTAVAAMSVSSLATVVQAIDGRWVALPRRHWIRPH